MLILSNAAHAAYYTIKFTMPSSHRTPPIRRMLLDCVALYMFCYLEAVVCNDNFIIAVPTHLLSYVVTVPVVLRLKQLKRFYNGLPLAVLFFELRLLFDNMNRWSTACLWHTQ